jgi:glycosyltransferase involved in cell wall biosynthesis
MNRCIHIVLSAPGLFGFMSGQSDRLRQLGFLPTIVSSASDWLDERAASEGARRVVLPICRDISLFRDTVSFIRLCRLFYREAPQSVLLSGPKAIFLGGMAAWLCGVQTRVTVYHGMRQENLRGPLRWILDACDKLSFASSTNVLAVSPSLRSLMIQRKLLDPGEVKVIGHGTANGVNPERFTITTEHVAASVAIKLALGIPSAAPVIGFVGRLTEDKGIADAYAVFRVLQATRLDLHFILVGSDEMRTSKGKDLLALLRGDSQVRLIEHTDSVEDYLNLFWVQVFPSAREGFGMVIAEAAALAVPTVAYNVTGVCDAIADGESGMLVPYGNTTALATALSLYLYNAELRMRHGMNGWSRTRRLYTTEHTWPSYLAALGLPLSLEKPSNETTMSTIEASALSDRERLLR